MCRISYIHYFCILNLAFDNDTQTRMKMRELTLREKQAIWTLKEKRKSIRAIEKTKGMKKSRNHQRHQQPTTTWSAGKTTVVDDRQIIKAVKMNPKRRVCKITNNFQKAGWCSDNRGFSLYLYRILKFKVKHFCNFFTKENVFLLKNFFL